MNRAVSNALDPHNLFFNHNNGNYFSIMFSHVFSIDRTKRVVA